MPFTLTNNSALAVVTEFTTYAPPYGVFTITSGSLPLYSGQTISGTNTTIADGSNSPYGTIQIFLVKGNAQIEVFINGTLYSALSNSSGLCSIRIPILSPTDDLIVNVDESELPTPSNTPSNTPTQTCTPTIAVSPTETSTPTPTPTITPSSTPYPIVQPSLWFDASDSSTMNLILSGGTTLISQITSKGTETWTLTGSTSDRYPTYSASTSLPGSPNIIRFTPNASTGLRKALLSFDNTPLLHSGSTTFVVWSQPAGTPAFTNQLYSGTTTGLLAQNGSIILDRYQFAVISTTTITNANAIESAGPGANVPAPYSATNLNNKYLMKVVLPANAGYGSWELNQSAGTSTSLFTGTTIQTQWNAFNLGCVTNNTQQIFATNNNIELAEIMIYNSELSSADQEAVELYLRDKWRYDEWASPVPTPTQTGSPTPSPTQP
jgi:hypothetical protein